MATLMMKSRRSSQGLLLLLSLLLLTFSAILAPIRGEGATDDGRKSKIVKAAVIHDDAPFNGCLPHDASALSFCCTKDHQSWPSLTDCALNCPGTVNCDETETVRC